MSRRVRFKLADPDDILADDMRKAEERRTTARGEKRGAYITLGDAATVSKRPTLLGPIMKQRFMGASASSS